MALSKEKLADIRKLMDEQMARYHEEAEAMAHDSDPFVACQGRLILSIRKYGICGLNMWVFEERVRETDAMLVTSVMAQVIAITMHGSFMTIEDRNVEATVCLDVVKKMALILCELYTSPTGVDNIEGLMISSVNGKVVLRDVTLKGYLQESKDEQS